ncbi:MAG: hypothetical protein SF028_08635 [Candidatus Sumerlaeia bacterium]|nr:hypothetical protein [Candidatus Sumerlaeia bacterium]
MSQIGMFWLAMVPALGAIGGVCYILYRLLKSDEDDEGEGAERPKGLLNDDQLRLLAYAFVAAAIILVTLVTWSWER